MEAVTRAQHWSPTQISTTGDKKVNRIIYRTRTAFLNQIAIMCISLFLYHVFHWIQVTDIRVRQTHAESSWGNCYYWSVQRHLLWAARSLFLSLREREADRASGVEQQTHCAATVTTYLSRKWVRLIDHRMLFDYCCGGHGKMLPAATLLLVFSHDRLRCFLKIHKSINQSEGIFANHSYSITCQQKQLQNVNTWLQSGALNKLQNTSTRNLI